MFAGVFWGVLYWIVSFGGHIFIYVDLRTYGAVGTVSGLLLRIGSDILRRSSVLILIRYSEKEDRVKVPVDRVGLRFAEIW